MAIDGFALESAGLALLAAVFYALEAALEPVVARRFPGYQDLDRRRRLQVRVRAFETVASAYLCIGGVVGALAYAAAGLNYVTGQSVFARGHCLALAAFYAFHLWRMAAAGGYARALYPHHLFMLVGLVCCLYYDVLFFYVLLSAVPAGGAVVRNARWAARIAGGGVRGPSLQAAALLILLLELPAPLFGFVHLFVFGRHDGAIPTPAWALVIAPAIGSTAMAAWFVAGAFREAARRPAPEST